MHLQRVVITGMGAVSPFGYGVTALWNALENGQSGISILDDLAEIKGLRPRIGGKVPACDIKVIPRKFRRTMSALSIFGCLAGLEALKQAGLTEEQLTGGGTGLCVGSTIGSVQAMENFFSGYLNARSIESVHTTEFFKIMNHSCASNMAHFFGISGRVQSTSAACSTGCQNIGLAAEIIASGKQDMMLCGGSEELHPLTVGTFDILEAASTSGIENPTTTPRPFDITRDGIVCSEGAGILLLESYESAIKRNAVILAEVVGFSSICDSSNMANPSPVAITKCIEMALQDSNISHESIDYINAHATGTQQGDAAECIAISKALPSAPPISSLKGHLGHTMAASGALETIATICMMNNNTIIPTRNLFNTSDDCKCANHNLRLQQRKITYALKNNFALGGINTSLVLRRPE